MQKPNESLDDFVVQAQEINTEPPSPVKLRLTGEVEVLKPLAVWEARKPVVVAAVAGSPAVGMSWFHRSLVAGGAFALIAVVLASAIFIAMYDGTVQPSAVSIEQMEVAEAANVDEPLSLEDLVADIFTTPSVETAEIILVTPTKFRNQKFRRSANRNRKLAIRRPTVEPFVPTTLIIYIDKGEVKSRVEPQLTAGYKRTPTLSN